MSEILPYFLDRVKVQKSIILNHEDRYREPGDDDGAFLSPKDPAWLEPDPWEAVLSILEDALPVQTSFYLDNNAQLGEPFLSEENQGVTEAEIEEGETEAERRNRIQGEMARSSLCLKTAAHFDGTTIHDDGSTSLFHHVLNCRKPWC